MRKSIIFVLSAALILLSTSIALATDQATDTTVSNPKRIDTVRIWSPNVTGYVMVDPAMQSGQEHTLRFAVLKTSGAITGFGTWQVQFDFASLSVVAAQAEHKQPLLGGTFQYYAGRVFTAGGQITPAPNGLYAPNWSSVYLPFTFIGDGFGTQYTYKGLDLYAVSTHRMSAAATYKGLEALWEDKVGTEIGYTTPYGVLEFHPSLKVLFFERGRNQYAGCNWFNLGHGLRCYQLAKWGVTEELSLGLTLDIPSVRLKGFYNLKAQTTFTEVVFSF